ncbi:CocE/NonD family hydrolase [Taklimakanibacter deserti]|uniref:CocE/NonD family hydrolase n=1 Tax=Taklimakanibacter deserti TaxID=2267839 RepID=UPI000E6580E6
MDKFRAALAGDASTPALFPEEAIVLKTVFVAMRDGCRLAAHLHLPPKLPAPVIAVRSPYGRARYAEISMALARRGHVVICQDVRGTGDSEPDSWDFYIHEREDSYDFVDWVAAQAWCDGFIGAMGGSYDGGTQFGMATNPKMTAIMPEVAGLGIALSHGVRFHMFLNAYSRTVGKGKDKVKIDRALLEEQMKEETWATGYFNDPLHAALPETVRALFPQLEILAPPERRDWLWKHYNGLDPAGRVDFLKSALGEETITFVTTTKLNPLFGADIDPDALMLPRASVPDLCGAIQAPALLVTGWYDWCLGDTLESFAQIIRQGGGRARQSRLLVTPGAHNVTGYHEGEEKHAALRRTYRSADNLELLLHWHGAVRDGRHQELPAVTYYLMGANEWLSCAAWPPPEAREKRLYLAEKGKLAADPPPASASPDTYIYDPDDPTPTLGGSILSAVYRAGSVDVSSAQARPDVLTYTTEILTEALDVVGPLRLILHASSSAVETDFYGRLSDVFPDGRAIQLQNGMLRTRYRPLAGDESELIEPGRIYRFEIDMWATANRFAAGHRLRLDISSADFPKFERNRNRGGSPGPSLKAKQTIFHDAAHPSHLVIPVIDRS